MSCHHPNCDCGYNLDILARRIDQVLNKQGLMSASQKTQLRVDLACKAKRKEWDEARTKAELKIHEEMPHYGLFIEEQRFENDEGNYQPVTKYALFHAKERISPWYWEMWTLADWATRNKLIIMSYLNLQKQLHSHRHPAEKFMRGIPND